MGRGNEKFDTKANAALKMAFGWKAVYTLSTSSKKRRRKIY